MHTKPFIFATAAAIQDPIPQPPSAPGRKRAFTISVRDLVAFVLRTGDLGGNGHFTGPNRALEGTRGHQRIQKSRPAGYKPEVLISTKLETQDVALIIKGRIDGILQRDDSLLIEEIKTVDEGWNGHPDPLHWAQAKVYAALYAPNHTFQSIDLQLTYLSLDSGQTAVFRETFKTHDLEEFLDSITREYLHWLEDYARWCSLRDSSIAALGFPFPNYRAGQRSLAVAVYRATQTRGKLLAEAPTGIGKTVSALFPAIKAFPAGHLEKIFYLTAKTIGRTVAEKTLVDLRSAGLRLRAVTITARDKICFNNGQTCDLKSCPFALGYYDRIKAAVRDGLATDELKRDKIEEIARKHRVCPFELSLDLSLWCDAIICDFNYVFDPSVALKRYFSEESRNYSILIDEAHNLVDRAREMFSAELVRDDLRRLQDALQHDLPACARTLDRLCSKLSALAKDESFLERDELFVSKSCPAKITHHLKQFIEQAELWLVQNRPSAFREDLLGAYFEALAFLRTSELFDERYAAIYDSGSGRLRLFCIDPSLLLQRALETSGSAVFFSATLRPGDYFRNALGLGQSDPFLQLTSPFPPENLCVLIQNKISTRLRSRAATYDAVAASIGALMEGRSGNYLVYFPSYDYLTAVLERFHRQFPAIETQAQLPGMSETDREEFIARFHTEISGAFAGFAVMGGIFGEGIDLVGERLIGAIIVGVGFPQISVERELIREYRGNIGRDGFDYAYTYPGMNRVLQAAGRLIRSETDRGIVLLIDDRFAKPQYRALFPSWWIPQYVHTPAQISQAATAFWDASTRITEQLP